MSQLYFMAEWEHKFASHVLRSGRKEQELCVLRHKERLRKEANDFEYLCMRSSSSFVRFLFFF